MPGTSKKTKAMMVRLPIDIAKKVELNAAHREMGVSEYLRRIIVPQIVRKR